MAAAEHGLCHGMSHKSPRAPYAPAPHLPKVAKTGRSVVIGPETFKLFVNAEGLVVRHEIEVHEPGKPAGPPGFYEGIGGVMLPPPA